MTLNDKQTTKVQVVQMADKLEHIHHNLRRKPSAKEKFEIPTMN
jgi:hypothetical protein